MASILCILPPYLLQHVAEHGSEHQRAAALLTLSKDSDRRQQRSLYSATAAKKKPAGKAGTPTRTVADCHHASATTAAKVMRKEGSVPTGDVEVDEAYDGLGATYDLYWQIYGRNSIDKKGMALNGFVHYGNRYDNAFWDGTEMIFGDGDGTTFNRFTISVDVIGHELTHGVTQHEANLEYRNQSGALNESVSDVFGSLVKQYSLKQSADEADWLIGAGLLTDKHDLGLRSMKAPGTAYNDPVLGHDPQPAEMADYVETDDDDGGVHVNSGIPNRAFYLAATGIGGNAWDGAGKVWYDTLTNSNLEATTDFAGFADTTIDSARKLFGAKSQEAVAVQTAWKQVGVID